MAKTTFPEYDICSLSHATGLPQPHHDVLAGPFARYLSYRPQLLAPHRHTFYHIVLFTKGAGTQTIDFEQFDIYPAQIYFMIPGQVHCWDFTGEIDGYVVNFTEQVFLSFMSNPLYLKHFSFLRGVSYESVIALNGDSLNEAIYFFNKIIEEANKKDAFSLDMVCIHLVSLFVSISRHNEPGVDKTRTGQKRMVIREFMGLVDAHYLEKKLPKDYAAMMFMTPNHLTALCSELLGKPAGQVIRDRILLEAKRLLTAVELNISEIAFHLNFTDTSYFTKFFKKYAGITPEEFKKSRSTFDGG